MSGPNSRRTDVRAILRLWRAMASPILKPARDHRLALRRAATQHPETRPHLAPHNRPRSPKLDMWPAFALGLDYRRSDGPAGILTWGEFDDTVSSNSSNRPALGLPHNVAPEAIGPSVAKRCSR